MYGYDTQMHLPLDIIQINDCVDELNKYLTAIIQYLLLDAQKSSFISLNTGHHVPKNYKLQWKVNDSGYKQFENNM